MERFRIRQVADAADRKAFLKLPGTLSQLRQDEGTVRQFLNGSHPLSEDACINHYLLAEGDEVKGRMTLTHYPGADTLYLGYFACIPDQAAADALFRKAREVAAGLSLGSVTGPMDVSFWISYRFKVTNFDRTFFGEPENPAYYPALFEAGGFSTAARYVSRYYRAMPEDHVLQKFSRRREAMKQRGIRIFHPDMKAFETYLDDIHGMLMELYADFPGFQPITRENFRKIYGSLKLAADPGLIALAYDGDKPAGFFIALPDYRDSLKRGLAWTRLWNLFRIRRKPARVVLAYAGVRRGYEGLGGALYYEVLEGVKERRLPVVSALIQEGKVTAGFEKELVEDTTCYRLYRMYL